MFIRDSTHIDATRKREYRYNRVRQSAMKTKSVKDSDYLAVFEIKYSRLSWLKGLLATRAARTRYGAEEILDEGKIVSVSA